MTTEPPTDNSGQANTLVIGPGALTPDFTEVMHHGAAVAEIETTVVRVSGSGAILCLQGMLTNDIEAGGADGFVYGALLTPKGMIVTDLWTARQHEDVQLFVPPEGGGSLLEILARALPPRLARCEDRTGTVSVFHLVGPDAVQLTQEAGFDVPAAGQSTTADARTFSCLVARPEFEQPFVLQIVCNLDTREELLETLERSGVTRVNRSALEAVRVLAGWPRLGAEIDARTLPQEARFDDIGGVSYTKGCYTGQETVARVHFRGRANRWLAGLDWDSDPDPDSSDIVLDGKTVGRVSSMVWLPEPHRVIGLGLVRREVKPDAEVVAARAPTRVCILPFDLD